MRKTPWRERTRPPAAVRGISPAATENADDRLLSVFADALENFLEPSENSLTFKTGRGTA